VEERSARVVRDGDDSPTVGISFEVYEILAVKKTVGFHRQTQSSFTDRSHHAHYWTRVGSATTKFFFDLLIVLG
jgi:hypothetical protein